jgi:hypothetical protein
MVTLQEHGVVWYKTGFLPPAGQDYDFGVDLVRGLGWCPSCKLFVLRL